MKFDKVNGKWFLDQVKGKNIHELTRLAEGQKYEIDDYLAKAEDVLHMERAGVPCYKEEIWLAKKPTSIIKETPEHVSELIEKYGAKRAANILHVSYSALRRYLDLNGLSSKRTENHPIDIDNLRDSLLKGLSVREIADKEGVHVNTIYSHMRANGLSAQRKGLSVSDLADALDSGASVKEAAREFRVTEAYLRVFMSRNNIHTKKRSGTKLSRQTLESYLTQGLSAQEIANKEHVHVQTVYQRIRAEGLRTPGKRISNTEMFNDLTELITSKDDPEKAYYELLKCLSNTAFKKELVDIISIL